MNSISRHGVGQVPGLPDTTDSLCPTNMDPLICSGIVNSLTNHGVTAVEDVSKALAGYAGIDPAVTNAVMNIANGGPITIDTVFPIVAAVIATAFPPAAGFVMAALTIVETLESIFGSSGSGQCAGWNVGSVCVTGSKPYGPTDPSWRKFDDWMPNITMPSADAMAAYQSMGNSVLAGQEAEGDIGGGIFSTLASNVANTQMDAAYPEYRWVIWPELTIAQNDLATGFWTGGSNGANLIPVPLTVEQRTFRTFQVAYLTAWKHNAEYAINGFQAQDAYTILTKFVEQQLGTGNPWNDAHMDSSTYTFGDPTNSPQLFLDRYVNGDFTGGSKPGPPIAVNTGAPAPQFTLVTGSELTSSVVAARFPIETLWAPSTGKPFAATPTPPADVPLMQSYTDSDWISYYAGAAATANTPPPPATPPSIVSAVSSANHLTLVIPAL